MSIPSFSAAGISTEFSADFSKHETHVENKMDSLTKIAQDNESTITIEENKALAKQAEENGKCIKHPSQSIRKVEKQVVATGGMCSSMKEEIVMVPIPCKYCEKLDALEFEMKTELAKAHLTDIAQVLQVKEEMTAKDEELQTLRTKMAVLENTIKARDEEIKSLKEKTPSTNTTKSSSSSSNSSETDSSRSKSKDKKEVSGPVIVGTAATDNKGTHKSGGHSGPKDAPPRGPLAFINGLIGGRGPPKPPGGNGKPKK
jgi:hypothetical protein